MALTDATNTLIVTWVFAFLSEGLMILRLILRKRRGQKFDISDYFTMAAMAFMLIRLALDHVVIVWGTNDVSEVFRSTHDFTPDDVYHRTVGSKLILAVRVAFIFYLWLQKSVLMCLYERMFFSLSWMEWTLRVYWAVLFATFVAAQATLFTECRPFSLYWQVLPDPGSCVYGITQLLTLALVTILTDTMLIVLPMPTLLRVQRTLKQKIQLIGLFSVGVVLVVITVVRLNENYTGGGLQVNRTIWASVEAFASAFVANAPTLYTLRRRSPAAVINSSRSRSYALTSRSTSDRRESSEEERTGIRVTRSVDLDVKYESPSFPARVKVLAVGARDWDHQHASDEEDMM